MRQFPDEYLMKMTMESGVVMATEQDRRDRYEHYRMEELQLLGAVQPGEGDLPEHQYEPTSAGELEVEQQPGEELRGEVPEDEEEHYPTPSDAGDSDDRGPFGDSAKL